MMRTFLKQMERIGRSARRWGGHLMLVSALLLCVWIATDVANASSVLNSLDPVSASPEELTPTDTSTTTKKKNSTYLFEVTTGVRTNDGFEDKIEFFIITYTTTGTGPNKTVSKFLFPSKDGWTKTYALLTDPENSLANHPNAQADEDAAIRNTYGYEAPNLKKGRSLFQSYSTDQYLFTSPDEITEIKRVQFFGTDHGNWDCRAMRIFHVDELDGLYRSNIASSDCYINFSGDLIAEGRNVSSQNLKWNNDKLIGSGSDAQHQGEIQLKTSGFDESYAHHDLQSNTNKTIALRLDFADVYGAGLESLGATSTTNNTLTNMGIAESMAVTVYYFDCYGIEHAVRVPAVLNSVELTKSLLSPEDREKPIGGFAQQGEGMALGIFLPDFVSLSDKKGVTVTLGAQEATNVVGLTTLGGRPAGTAGTLRADRIKVSETDTISVVTMAIYDMTKAGDEAVQISAKVNDKTNAIEYSYRTAKGDTADPIYYRPVQTTNGNSLKIGSNSLSITAYESGKLLAPRDKTERYLLELVTDDLEGAGTKDDILMTISWIDLNGNAKVSGTLNVRELSRDFNGWWFGSTEQDIGYYEGVASGQTLRFLVPLQQVKEITDIQVWMAEGGSRDDWQMKDLRIFTVTTYSKRNVVWEAFSQDGVTSPLRYDREVSGDLVYRFSDNCINPALIQQGADTLTNVGPTRTDNIIGEGAGADVNTVKRVDWSKYRFSMTYQEASQDLGFGKQRFLYAVTVNVAGNGDATLEDGDCGSNNLFYFCLIFKNGCSGYVLANQQLPSDGFISGASQTFYISTNQDYGDVTAVQIIPEDLSEDSDAFDKLNIDSIEIKRQSNSALVPVWTISNVGWISIDYRDNAQMQSVTGMAGRGAAELARSYTVDGSTFDVNFMLAITTQGYPMGGSQFVGNLAATVYYDSYSPSKGSEELSDVTKSMYSYMNRTPLGSSDLIGGKTISDPSLMFRADHTDRFYFSLSDVKSINRIELAVTSAVDTEWRISDVSLFLVNGEGSLSINRNGEYQRIYRVGEELTELAHGDSESSPAYSVLLQHYDGTTNSFGEKMNAEPMLINIYFNANDIPMNPEAAQWSSIISREPPSENDTLSLFVYPDEDAKADPTFGPVAAIVYTNTSDETIQVSSGDMMIGGTGISATGLNQTMYNGQKVYYMTGINASRFKALQSVTLFEGQGSGIQGTVRAVVRQIRSGVVIRTWELERTGSTNRFGLELSALTSVRTERKQQLQLQLGNDVPKMTLSDKNNLAVAVWYRTDDITGAELRSPYIYLTDKQYTEIGPGQVIDLTFEEKCVGEITGINIVGMGEVSGTIDSARVVDYEYSLDTRGIDSIHAEYGFTTPTTISGVPNRMTPNGTVGLLTLDFETGEPAEGMHEGGGTNGPVSLTVGFFDAYGNLIQRNYSDIRPYLIDGAVSFPSNSKTTARLMVKDIAQLRWIEVEPKSDIPSDTASWTLNSMSALLGDSGKPTDRVVKTIVREGTPQKIIFADVTLHAKASTEGDSETTVKFSENGVLDILAKSGGTVTITPILSGSYDGWTATADRIVDGFPASASTTISVDKDKITFTAPENTTGSTIQYRITVRAVESPEIYTTVNIGVENAPPATTQEGVVEITTEPGTTTTPSTTTTPETGTTPETTAPGTTTTPPETSSSDTKTSSETSTPEDTTT